MKQKKNCRSKGFSLIELIISMAVVLILLGLVSTLLAAALGTRKRESRKTDALTSAQAALNVMSREIANTGFGLKNSNGLVVADSDKDQLHFRANVQNIGSLATNDIGEDLTYFYDGATKSIVRFDPYDTPQTSVIVNRISNVNFDYYDYAGSNSAPTGPNLTPTNNTGRITITVTVNLENVQGQPDGQKVTLKSAITLRNSEYMLNQY